EYLIEWKEGIHSIKFVGFARIDQYDRRRTHGDIRELYWQTYNDDVDFSLGFNKVFWGKTESVHLVDIINQTDAVESFDGEAKLGEFMAQLTFPTSLGTMEIFYLPLFRKRVFAGRKGRLRPGDESDMVIDSRDFGFQANDGRWSPSVAARLSNYVGALDFGISYFHGTGREPIITDFSTFNSVYGLINQVGVELQVTTGSLLVKLESIYRANRFQDVFALAGGIEYTFGNVGGSGLDIGILSEYLYDDRDELALNGLQSDVFGGIRLGLNDVKDTQVLMGAIFDVNRTTDLYFIESSRRIGSSWKGVLEARIFQNVDPSEFTYFIRDDSFLQAAITKYF
ncbi:MAG: hypothetical protein AAGA66_21720, partial [Bacteroidota bacterium]